MNKIFLLFREVTLYWIVFINSDFSITYHYMVFNYFVFRSLYVNHYLFQLKKKKLIVIQKNTSFLNYLLLIIIIYYSLKMFSLKNFCSI